MSLWKNMSFYMFFSIYKKKNMGKSLTYEEFMNLVQKVHGNKDILDKTEYAGMYKPITLACPEHGEYTMLARYYLRGNRCPKCRSRKTYTKEELINLSRQKHGNKYDYSEAENGNIKSKVTIICPIHGKFSQVWGTHIGGCGCPACSGKKKKTTEEFVKEYKERYGDFCDTSKVEYANAFKKVCLVCPKHGEFWATPHYLLTNKGDGNGCPQCGKEKVKTALLLTEEDVIDRIREIHGDYYDLSKVHYDGMYKKIEMICPEHGSFWIRPHNVVDGKQGCPECGKRRKGLKLRHTTDDFIAKANMVHGTQYDYSKVEYTCQKESVCIICHNIDSVTGKEHGEFWQTPADHLAGCGCKKCTHNQYNYTVEEYVEKANIIHNNKYDYSKLPTFFENYSKSKITVICPQHGEFKVLPYAHLTGTGCPSCQQSHLENEIESLLKKNDIEYEKQKTFDWLFKKTNDKRSLLKLDFYLPSYNIAIECQGVQHFEENDFFGGHQGFLDIVTRDKIKNRKCIKHGLAVIYYTNVIRETYPYDIITNQDTLLKTINGVV